MENIFVFNAERNFYVIVLSTTVKASKNQITAVFVQVFVASSVPRLRQNFTLRVCLTPLRLNKLGKLPDFPGFRAICWEQPRQTDANFDADCNKYCTRIQDPEQLVEY